MLPHLQALGRDLARGLLHLLYPGTCATCGTALPPDQDDFCTACRAALTADPHPTCPRCASTVGPFVPLDDGCTRCRERHHRFERAVRLGPYDGLLRQAILTMKHARGEDLAELLGRLWAAHGEVPLRDLHADCVVPVPLHWVRRLWRGHNQSEQLARPLAARLGLPLRASWLRRIRNTPMQTQQTASARPDNVRGAFRCPFGVNWQGQTILLVDDVLTTGSTASEAAAALRAAGAGRVVVAVLAHAQS